MLRVAIVQAEVAADLAGGLELTDTLARRAAADGARLIVFPETWLPGYPAWLDVCRDVALWDHVPVKAVYGRMAEQSLTVPGEACTQLGELARETKSLLVVGVIERVESGYGAGTLFNSILTFGPDGRILNHHRKLIPTYTERLVWGPGDADGLRAVKFDDTRVGALVCWEHWMPLARQALHESGEDVHAALWPTVHEMHQIASRNYAFEARCFVLAAGSLMRASALPSPRDQTRCRFRVPEPARGTSLQGPTPCCTTWVNSGCGRPEEFHGDSCLNNRAKCPRS